MPTGSPASDSASGSEIAGSPVAFCSGVNADPFDEPIDDLLVVGGGIEVADPWCHVGQRRRKHGVVGSIQPRGDAAQRR